MGETWPAGAAGQDGTLSGSLAEARGRGFVGRAAELRAFTASLEGSSDVRVHVVHGPGGIGKTTLLEAFSRAARHSGRRAVYLDARDVEPTAAAVTAAIAERTRAQGFAPGEPAEVLLVDGYELLAPLDRWFREDLLPSRPRGSVTVVAGRMPPSPAWHLDAGWRRLACVHALGALDTSESDELLSRLGVPATGRATMAGIGRGHPLVLAMLAEAGRDSASPVRLAEAPDVVGRLCRLIVDDVPDAAHRTGLATCAHATRMTADLLRQTVGPRAEEVWAWLESRPYVRRGSVGLFLHDVVREIFEAELFHRSPDAYVALHVAVRGYFLDRLSDPAEPHPDRAAAEIIFLDRRGPLSATIAALREGGLLPVALAGPEDVVGILSLIEDGEGAVSAELARRWIAEQPRCLYRARSDAGVEAFSMHVYLPTGGDLDSADPVASAVLAAVEELGPLRPGERIVLNRFQGASASYQRDPMLLLVNGVAGLTEFSRRAAAWAVATTVDADHYGPYLDFLGYRRIFRVVLSRHPGTTGDDAREVVGYGWDRRRLPFSALFDLMARRELSGETGPPPPEMLRPVPLARPAFAAAVRCALLDVTRPDRLAASPLLGSALVDAHAADPAGTLRRTLVSAIAALADERRGAEHRRVLELTYLRGAPSQEAAAERLDLPFSTYRRHLAQAQDRLVEVLWAAETGQGVSRKRSVG